ncbi:MAG: flagellar protein [Roseibium sp.]
MTTVSTISTSRNYLTQQLLDLKDQLSEKTSQLASGKVGTTYGEIGDRRLLDIQLTQKVSLIETYKETVTIASLHLETLNLSLDRLETIRRDSKSAVDINDFVVQSDGKTQTQDRAKLLLNEAINVLNTEVAGHYLFGGTDAVDDPVESIDAIINGSGGRDGLKTYISEYSQANLGPNSNGRVDVSALTTTPGPIDSTFTVAEDGAHDFGFDISSVTSTLSNVTVTPLAAADPETFDVQFTGQPALGETFELVLSMPPTHTDTIEITLTAATTTQEDGSFVVGADLAETAQNLRDAVATEMEKQAQTTLKAVSDEWASDQFFNTYNGQEPQRVDGPPFDTATALTAGGATTVSWYTGRNTATTDPRGDKNAIVDRNLSVEYGVRANETPLKELVQSLSTFIAADFSGGTVTDEQYYNALAGKMQGILQPSGANQSGIVDISTDIAIAHRTVQVTDERHTQTTHTYQQTIADIEGIDQDRVAAEILQLKTNLEISYNASAIVFKLSLADYL